MDPKAGVPMSRTERDWGNVPRYRDMVSPGSGRMAVKDTIGELKKLVHGL